MICVNCGSLAHFVYKNNSLCWHCYELTRLLEYCTVVNMPQDLHKEALIKIKECRYWIKVNRLANKYDYPEIVK